jgi:hypothetical protein
MFKQVVVGCVGFGILAEPVISTFQEYLAINKQSVIQVGEIRQPFDMAEEGSPHNEQEPVQESQYISDGVLATNTNSNTTGSGSILPVQVNGFVRVWPLPSKYMSRHG